MTSARGLRPRPRWLVGAGLTVAMLASACSADVAESAPSETAVATPTGALMATASPQPIATPTSTPTPRASPAAAETASGAPGDWILYDPTLDVPAAIDAALADARAQGKLVLLEFGGDWCPDCHVLASYLEEPRAKQILDASYIVVRVDVGYFDRNLETATRYGDVIAVGVPSIVILAADGTKLVDTAGGELADSTRYSADDVADFLASWAT